MNYSSKVLQNTGSLMFSYGAEKLLLYLLFVFIAKEMGPEMFGRFFIAFSFCSIVFIFNELGLTATVSRNVACNEELYQKYFSNFFGVRVFSLIITFIILLGILYVVDYSEELEEVIYMLSFYFVLSYLSHPFVSIFRGYKKMHYIALMTIVDRAIVAVSGMALIVFGGGVAKIAIAFIFGGIARIAVGYFILYRKFSGRFELRFDFSFWKELLKKTQWVAIFMILTLVLLKVDTLILVFFDYGEEVIGNFNASQLIFTTFIIPATAYTHALFPVFAKMSSTNNSQTFIYFMFTFFVLGGVMLVSAIFLYSFSSGIIDFIYGDKYELSITILEIFSIALPLYSLNAFIQWSLISVGKNKLSVALISALIATNMIFNFIMIPRYGAEGAAWTMVMTQFLTLITSLFFISFKRKVLFRVA